MALTITASDLVYGTISGGTLINLTISTTSPLNSSGVPTDTFSVSIGGAAATSVIPISAAQISCITGAALAPGPSDIVITDVTLSQTATLTDGFAYLEPGVMCLDQLITYSKQRSDLENSNFISYSEWSSYINQSAYELYDLLITAYGNDYYCAPALQFPATGTTNLFALPNGVNYNAAPAFYKLIGVDLQISGTQTGQNSSSWVTLKPFKFSERNKWSVPSSQATFWGFYNMHYRLNGSNMLFQPTPAGGTQFQLWYIPRLVELVNPTDVLDGISGWTEFVIIDAAIKALQKEESDVSVLAAQKAAITQRINSTAENRDSGFPQCVGDTQNLDWNNGGGDNGFGWGNG